MISPEAHGGLGAGSLEARFDAVKRDRLDFSNGSTTNSIERENTPSALGLMGEIGFFEKLDFYLIPSFLSPTILGAKYQILGNAKKQAKRGNFSTSILFGYGGRSETDVGNDAESENVTIKLDDLEVETTHYDVGLISGYRWNEKLLHYGNVVYLRETVRGKVTTADRSLVDEKYRYYHDGLIYSTGIIYYFAKAHWKLDYSHFVSDWSKTEKQTINTLNFALGFNW